MQAQHEPQVQGHVEAVLPKLQDQHELRAFQRGLRRLSAVDLATLKIEAHLNGALVQTLDLSTLVRDAATLLADVNAFMTLQPGDVLLLGTDCLTDGGRPLAQAGDRIELRAKGFSTLSHTLVAQNAAQGGTP